MLIPMEILSQMITRTGSGADTRQKTTGFARTDDLFSDVLGKTQQDMDHQTIDTPLRNGENTDSRNAVSERPQRPDRRTQEDESLIAGVMGYRNMVVFILEGDKESATTHEMSIDGIEMSDATDIIDIEASEEAELPISETEEFSDAINQAAQETANDQTATITASDVANALDEQDAAIDEAAAKADETDIGMGEVTARRPNIRTSDREGDADDKSDVSANGYLSPLENENDTAPIRGQKERTNSQTDNSDGSATEDNLSLIDDSLTPITDSIRPERFQGAEQMRRTADAPVRAENLFDEMVSRIETMHAESKQTVSIQLKPEFLGKVALEIAMDAAGLHVKINAANNDVRIAINSQVSALVESLEHKGIEVVEVEVAYTGVDNGAYRESQNNHAQSDNRRRSFRYDGIDDSAAVYAALPFGTLDYYLDVGVSSVEYSA